MSRNTNHRPATSTPTRRLLVAAMAAAYIEGGATLRNHPHMNRLKANRMARRAMRAAAVKIAVAQGVTPTRSGRGA